eukprot:1578957-Pyramimonas_sp.AAC.1
MIARGGRSGGVNERVCLARMCGGEGATYLLTLMARATETTTISIRSSMVLGLTSGGSARQLEGVGPCQD